MKGDFNMNKNWNTPLIKIHYEYNGKRDYFYTKLEYNRTYILLKRDYVKRKENSCCNACI